MKVSLIVPTNGMIQRLSAFFDSFRNTMYPNDAELILIDNANEHKLGFAGLVDDWRRTYRANIRLITLPKATGLTKMWDLGAKEASNNWMMFLNDDILFTKNWDIKFQLMVEQNYGINIYLLCNPYGWSGWGCNRNFLKEFPFRTEFPGIYFEDDDIYLRVAHANNLKTKHDVYHGPIYDQFTRDGESLFIHKHINDPKRNIFLEGNEKMFRKLWIKCSPNDPDAIQGKNGRDYYKKAK